MIAMDGPNPVFTEMNQVSYRLENRSLTSKKAKEEAKGFGLDPTSESYRQKCLAAAAELGPQFVERTKLDLATAAEWFNRENATDAEVRSSFLIHADK